MEYVSWPALISFKMDNLVQRELLCVFFCPIIVLGVYHWLSFITNMHILSHLKVM